MTARAALRAALVALVVSAGAALAVWAFDSGPGAEADTADSRAVAAAERFLDRYVTSDGAVVRTDQGGDVVSEGQGYAMLAAVAIADEERFRRIWNWTRENLQRDDGLFAWRWADGSVVDSQSAADGDLDVARALVLAAGRFDDPSLDRAGERIARAVVSNETVSRGGRRTLVAGPWARADRTVNPSYFSPRAYGVLAKSTGDRTWEALATDARTIVGDLLSIAPSVVPDWARLDEYGAPRPAPSPGGEEEPGFGLDAQRVPLRFAESCSDEDRRLAAALWPFLRERREDLRARYDMRGAAVTTDRHAVTAASGAAAAAAAGDAAARDQLLDEAESLDRRYPTYYGSAWVALARLTLTTDRLASCSRATTA